MSSYVHTTIQVQSYVHTTIQVTFLNELLVPFQFHVLALKFFWHQSLSKEISLETLWLPLICFLDHQTLLHSFVHNENFYCCTYLTFSKKILLQAFYYLSSLLHDSFVS